MYREILTKAIIAKGEKEIVDDFIINFNNKISKVLGCFVINHKHNVYLNDQKIFIKGSYEANLWFSHSDNTCCELIKKTYEFDDEIPFNFTLEKSNLSNKNDLIDYEITSPSCIEFRYDNNDLIGKIIRKYQVDIVGETKIKIKVDDVIIDEMINTNYVNENRK